MNKDPIVQEVRAIRHEIERECGSSAEAYYNHILSVQKSLGNRVVKKQPQLVKIPLQNRQATKL